jgi:hypothetical protein
MEDSNMSSNYSPSVADVLSHIRFLGQQNATVELKKSYKGIEIHEDVSIIEVNLDDAVFHVTNTKTCAALEGYVYLHSHLFPKQVIAQIKNLDLNRGMLVLSDFSFIDSDWKERKYERVQPIHPTYATLHWKGKTVSSCVRNISVEGIGLLVYQILEKGMRIQPGSNVQLDFELSPDHKKMSLKGTVIHMNTISRYTSAIGMRLFPKVKDARSLERYVTQRKQEIVEEINQGFWELVMPKRVESLFF